MSIFFFILRWRCTAPYWEIFKIHLSIRTMQRRVLHLLSQSVFSWRRSTQVQESREAGLGEEEEESQKTFTPRKKKKSQKEKKTRIIEEKAQENESQTYKPNSLSEL